MAFSECVPRYTLDTGNMEEFCKGKAEIAEPSESIVWQFFQASFSSNPAQSYLSILGFDAAEIYAKFNNMAASDLLDDFSVDEFVSLGRKGSKLTDFSIPTDESNEGLLNQALLSGNIEFAVELCLKQKRWTDGLILASIGGPDLIKKTSMKYLKKFGNKTSNIILAVVTRDLRRLTEHCDLHCWKEALAADLMYSDPIEFTFLAETLARRLQSSRDENLRKSALICYICCGDVTQLIDSWASEARNPVTQEQLQSAVEQLTVLQKLGETHGKAFPYLNQMLAEKLEKFGSVVTSQAYTDKTVQNYISVQEDESFDLSEIDDDFQEPKAPAPKKVREKVIRTEPLHKIEAHPDGCCRLCPSTFSSQVQLAKHIRRSHSGIKHKCRHCDREFGDSSNRNRHEQSVHATSRDFVCELCGKGFTSSFNLKSHVLQFHEKRLYGGAKKIPQQCETCGKVCNTMKYLKNHIRQKHANTEIIAVPCPICGRPVKRKEWLRHHLRTHLSAWERKELQGKTFFYKCSVCPIESQVGFKSKVSLQDHYNTAHPNEDKSKLKMPATKNSLKKHFCTECPGLPGYTRREALRQHIASGHRTNMKNPENKEKECKVCGKPCRDPTRAKLHENTHQRARGHVCPICRIYKQYRREMRNHYQKVHRGTPLPKLVKYKKLRRYHCMECEHNPGFNMKKNLQEHIDRGHQDEPKVRKNRAIISVPSDEIQDDDYNIDHDQDSNSSSDSDDEGEDYSGESEAEESLTQRFSSKGRMLKPIKRFKGKKENVKRKSRTTSSSVSLDKKACIKLERIDENWPQGATVVELEEEIMEDDDDFKEVFLPDFALKVEDQPEFS